jgi:hypothetical protein
LDAVKTDRTFNPVFAPIREDGDEETGEKSPNSDEVIEDRIRAA